MAWAAVAVAGTVGSSVANSTAITVTLNTQAGVGAAAGDFLVAGFGLHNFSSVSNADNGDVLSVADSGSNTWVKAREVTHGGATPATTVGTVCSVWYTRARAALTTSNTVVATLGSSASRDSNCGIVYRFTAPGGARVANTTHLIIATSSAGSIDQAQTATEFLRVRVMAARTTLTAMTTTAGWTSIGTARGSAATPTQAIFGEYLITAASTAASSPALTAAGIKASVYVVFEEDTLMGDGIF
jgi:hypothetical protein